jgi:predicted transcriptional regulator
MKPRETRGHAASGVTATPPGRLTPQDEHIFRDLMERFAVLSEMCFRFSQDIYLRTGAAPGMDVEETIRRNNSIARRVFADRFLEVLATIYLKKGVGARELADTLGRMSIAELSRKLRILETAGLVESGPSFGQPDSIRYSLTHKGTVIARLGEPVFLYLRLAEGWTTPVSEVRASAEAHAPAAEAYEASART